MGRKVSEEDPADFPSAQARAPRLCLLFATLPPQAAGWQTQPPGRHAVRWHGWVSLGDLWTAKTSASSLCVSPVLLSTRYQPGHLGKQELLGQNPISFCVFRITITGKCCCPSLLKYNGSMVLILIRELFRGRHSSKCATDRDEKKSLTKMKSSRWVWLAG